MMLYKNDIYTQPRVMTDGVFLEIPQSGVAWCCEELKAKLGSNVFTTMTYKERINGITRWHINCPFCETTLIASMYSMRPDKEAISKD